MIKEGYELVSLLGEWIVFPVAEKMLNTKGVLSLNDTGVFIWNAMCEDINQEKIVERLVKEYDIDKEIALKDVIEFEDGLRNLGILI